MACIYIINGKKFSEIDQSAIDELIKADLIEPNSAKTIAMAYQIAKEDNTNPDFTDKIDAILNNSPQQSEQTQDTPQAEVKTETPKESETTTTPSSSPSSEVSAPNNVEIKTYDDIKK